MPTYNPFITVEGPSTGTAADIFPIFPSDVKPLSKMPVALYCGDSGTIAVTTASGADRTFPVQAFSVIPVGVQLVKATGTTVLQVYGLSHY